MSSQLFYCITVTGSKVSADACLKLIELKKTNHKLFSTLTHLNRKLDKIRLDPALSEVKTSLLEHDCDEEDVEECYSLMKLYGYTMPGVDDSKVRSVFPVQSLLSHSCQPNLQYIEKEGGRKLVLQATTRIDKGSKLTVRYTPFLQGRLTLQKWLVEQRYVECHCPRCLDSTELGTFTR